MYYNGDARKVARGSRLFSRPNSAMFMLPRSERIHLQKDFERIFQKGRAYHSQFLVLKTVHNDLSVNRFAVVVSNKISKKATERNRLKRRIRGILRKETKRIKKQGNDWVLLTKNGILALKYPQIEQIVENLLKKASLL